MRIEVAKKGTVCVDLALKLVLFFPVLLDEAFIIDFGDYLIEVLAGIARNVIDYIKEEVEHIDAISMLRSSI
jgi:hypothetical protein